MALTFPLRALPLVAVIAAACSSEHRPAAPVADLPGVPPIPAGLDAYRQWERLPYLRIGARGYLRSTYDRAGGNEGADASHFLRLDAQGRGVALDVEGPGVLYFVRANRWHGSPWHYVVDGDDHVVTETSTADPASPVAGSAFEPASAFPSPLAITWSASHGADLDWVPIPFTRSLTLAWERTHYGTGYFIYHLFPAGTPDLSQPLAAWDESPPDPAVVAWIANAGQDLAPSGPDVRTDRGTADVPASGAVTLIDLATGPAQVRALRLRAPAGQAEALSGARVRVTWDGRAEPSIDTPVGYFFGSGSLYDRSGAADLVRAALASVRFEGGDVALAMYYPMPFFEHARVEMEGGGEPVTGVSWEVVTEPFAGDRGHAGYFHATFHDHGAPVPGHDLVLLDTTVDEGGGDWCGHLAGTSFTFSDDAVLTTLEGDPRFFFDDSRTPQAQGTGTEEWGGGGDYWGGHTTTLPFAGHPAGAPSAAASQGALDRVESAYRFLVADILPFGRNARVQLEHGGVDDSTERYRTLTYWYGRPGACLVPTDTLHVGDPADEAAHGYASPTASAVESLTSRFEWGVDHLDGKEIYPAITDTGRHMTGDSEFSLAVDPDNRGVLLRRELDYGWPDQRAEVSVAGDAEPSAFQPAGVWYLAGSSTCVYSNPPGELDAPDPVVETSDRRFREDEFLLPPSLTRGRSRIRVRIRFAPRAAPLMPGTPPPVQAWSEFRYWAYSYVLPGP
jgi:hypothetical protein